MARLLAITVMTLEKQHLSDWSLLSSSWLYLRLLAVAIIAAAAAAAAAGMATRC
jgi:hypothetical protein